MFFLQQQKKTGGSEGAVHQRRHPNDGGVHRGGAAERRVRRQQDRHGLVSEKNFDTSWCGMASGREGGREGGRWVFHVFHVFMFHFFCFSFFVFFVFFPFLLPFFNFQFSIFRLDVRIAAAKDGSLLATRTRKVDSHLAVVAGAVILAHEDVEKRTQAFLEMLGKGEFWRWRWRWWSVCLRVSACVCVVCVRVCVCALSSRAFYCTHFV